MLKALIIPLIDVNLSSDSPSGQHHKNVTPWKKIHCAETKIINVDQVKCLVDDSDMKRGTVRLRVILVSRSVEVYPAFRWFVLCQRRKKDRIVTHTHTHTHTQFCPIFVPRNLWANTRFFSLRNQSMPSRRRATPKAWMRTTHIHWIDDASPLLVYGVLNKLSIRWSAVHVVLTWIAAPSPVTLDGCKSLTCIWCIK